MEDLEGFNAGKGSSLTATGHVENDASLMDGSTMNAGSVASISGIKNPIEAARLVLDQTPHVQLAGDKASLWAMDHGLQTENMVSGFILC